MSRKIAPRLVGPNAGQKGSQHSQSPRSGLGLPFVRSGNPSWSKSKGGKNLAGLLVRVNRPGSRIIAEPLEAASKANV